MLEYKLVLIGASTGGPGHLKSILKDLPKDLKTPIVVAQHMGEMFIPSFVQQFANDLKPHVQGIDDGMTLEKGGIYICQKNTCFVNKISPPRVMLGVCQGESTHNPNIDMLFSSAKDLCSNTQILAILLTGIGSDGAFGLFELHERGAICIGESEESAIVYGMPKKAKELIPTLTMLSIDKIKERLGDFI